MSSLDIRICKKSKILLQRKYKTPRLVWLSGLSAGLQTKGSPVRFLVRAHAWVVGQVLVGGTQEETTHGHFSPSLPPPLLSKNK